MGIRPELAKLLRRHHFVAASTCANATQPTPSSPSDLENVYRCGPKRNSAVAAEEVFLVRRKRAEICFAVPRPEFSPGEGLARTGLGHGREVFEGEEPFEIIAYADQGPFERHFRMATQTEAPESHHLFYDSEHRFDRLLAQFV